MNVINAVKATAVIAAAVCTAFAQTQTQVQQSAAAKTGTFTDKRDGKKYKTVTIGKQTWMAENLNHLPQSGDSWCYKNDSSNCDKHGRLYDFKTAQTVCPSGFHLPLRHEWDGLAGIGGGGREWSDNGNPQWRGAGKKLKARSGWVNRKDGSDGNGTDDYGFSALPGGFRLFVPQSGAPEYGNGIFTFDNWGFWWTATEDDSGYVSVWSVSNVNDDASDAFFPKRSGFSVRCVAGPAPRPVPIPKPPPPPPSPSPPPVKYGSLRDARDGKTYKTVVIGGKRWMAENLNHQPQEGGSWCYKDDTSNCDKYGRLYDFQTAMTTCPKGFRLPSRTELDSLAAAAGGERKTDDKGRITWYDAGKRLKAKDGWKELSDGGSGNGTDDYGFSALPGGLRLSTVFGGVGAFGYWWTATENDNGRVNIWTMEYSYDGVNDGFFPKSFGSSVRCVADN
jgi:uncharacterized protein (TIGR02145 family)